MPSKRKKKKRAALPAFMRVSDPQHRAALYRSGAGKHKDKRKGKGGSKTWRRFMNEDH